jgi:hypothetical protein
VSSESNFSVTVKTPKGSLFTVRGDEASEFVTRIESAVEASIEFHVDMLEKAISGQTSAPVVAKQDPVAIVQKAMGGTVVSSTPVEPWEQEQSGFAPVPPPQQTAPAGGPETVQDRWGSKWTYGRADAPTCPNGPMVLKQGTNQSGKSYVGWFDPAGGPRWQGAKIPSGDQTAPQFGVKV